MNHFKSYLQSWLDWAEKDDPQDDTYMRCYGLCDNVWEYVASLQLSSAEQYAVRVELNQKLNRLFEGELYPFGEEAFDKHGSDETMHKDPNRLAWVRKMLEEGV